MSILVVDDEEVIRQTLPPVLTANRIRVRSAASREEAERILEDDRFDLVITDLHLSGADDRGGFDVLVASKRSSPETPVILFTALAGPEIEEEARRIGAAGLWSKGMSIDAILVRLRGFGFPTAA